MKKLFTLWCMVLLGVAAFAQTSLTKEERSKAIDHLKDTQAELLKTVKGLSDEQLNFKPDADTWSIAECVEHIAVTEAGLFEIVKGTLQAEPDPSKRAEVSMADEDLLNIIESRERKVKTRPEMEPANKFGGFDGSLEAFKAQRAVNMKFVKSTEDDLRNRYFDFPFGKADAYQVMLFISGHSKRHTDQIKEVIANADFPKS
ncbi:MAG: DinB family protein [Ekhidna sp.]|uniref:DinB family protein n=1 Tax=Ekhidna sp. TaxID=2608089 RepID=UPI0032ECA4FE